MSEIFLSVQGEGPRIGEPSIFVRFAYCNLSCSWCDTKYAWDFEKYEHDGEVDILPIEEIVDNIIELTKNLECINIVFTGGEPLLQENAIVKIIKMLYNKDMCDYLFLIETNGTIPPKELKPINNEDVVLIVSPKLKNSGMNKIPVVAHLIYSYSQIYWKFVVNSIEDFEEIDRFVEEKQIYSPIYIMPQCVVLEQLINSEYLIPECIKRGYTYSPRLQVLFGKKRGF